MADERENERLRSEFQLARALEMLKDLDRLNADAGPAMDQDVDEAMRARAARIEAAGEPRLSRRFLKAWEALSQVARLRSRHHNQVTADAVDDAIEDFERVWGDTQAWLDAHTA
jgi:hypothetical protein